METSSPSRESIIERPVYHRSAPQREALIAERQRFGHDTRDEVWEGVYVMSPAANRRHSRLQAHLMALLFQPARQRGLRPLAEFNLGTADDFRIPDLGFDRVTADDAFVDRGIAIVVEVLSPDERAYAKFGFYFRHGVEEIAIVDPEHQSVHWYVRGKRAFEPADRSTLLDINGAQLAVELDW